MDSDIALKKSVRRDNPDKTASTKRSTLVLLVLLVCCLVGLAPALAYLWPAWMDSFSYSHGLLIAGISTWLLWRQLPEIDAAMSKPYFIAAIPLFITLVAWTISYAAAIEIGVQAMLPFAIWLTVLAGMGFQVARLLAFPIGFLFFAIPVWDYGNEILLNFTVKAVSLFIGWLRVPAYIVGNSVQIPSGWFEIAGGCSGLHFFIVALALSALYGHLYYRSWTAKGILLAAGALLAIVCNWIRVTIIITAGHLTEMQSYLVQVDHYTFGWVLFGIMLIPFFLIARKLESLDESRPEKTGKAQPGSAVEAPIWYVVILSGLLLSPAIFWTGLMAKHAVSSSLILPEIPGWSGPSEYSGSWSPAYPGLGPAGRGVYSGQKGDLVAYARWYPRQFQGQELIGGGSSVVGEGFRRTDSEKVVAPAPAALVREARITDRNGERFLVWYWYRVDGRSLVSPIQTKLLQGSRALLGKDGVGVIALMGKCDDDCEAASHGLKQAFRDMAGPMADVFESE